MRREVIVSSQFDAEIRLAVAVHVAGDHGQICSVGLVELPGLLRESAIADEREVLVAGEQLIGVDVRKVDLVRALREVLDPGGVRRRAAGDAVEYEGIGPCRGRQEVTSRHLHDRRQVRRRGIRADEIGLLEIDAARELDAEIRLAVTINVAGDGCQGFVGGDAEFPGMMGELAIADEGKVLIAGHGGVGVDVRQVDLVVTLLEALDPSRT